MPKRTSIYLTDRTLMLLGIEENGSDTKNLSGRLNQIVDRYSAVLKAGNSSLAKKFTPEQMVEIQRLVTPNWNPGDRYASVISDFAEAVANSRLSAQTDTTVAHMLKTVLPDLHPVELLALIELAEANSSPPTNAKD